MKAAEVVGVTLWSCWTLLSRLFWELNNGLTGPAGSFSLTGSGLAQLASTLLLCFYKLQTSPDQEPQKICPFVTLAELLPFPTPFRLGPLGVGRGVSL